MSDKKSFGILALLTIAAIVLYPNIVKAGIVTYGLVSFWTFDTSDMENGTVKDIWGSNDGTIDGDAQRVAGKIEDGLEFDGINDQVDCGNGASLDITGPITVEAWFYPTGPGDSTFPRIVDKSDDPGYDMPGYKVYLRPGENYVITLSAGGTHEISTLAAIANAWNYVAFIITGEEWRLFLNGEWQTWARTDLPTSVGEPLYIGNSPVGARHFLGIIDEVRVYDRALTEDEVLDNYEVVSNFFSVESTGKLAATWASIKIR